MPIGTWTTPRERVSARYSTRPPLNSVTARPTSVVTVPVFGLGIRPRGPSLRPSRPDLAHQVRRGDGDVEVHEPAVDAGHQVVGSHHVGSGGPGRLGRLPGGEDRHAHLLAGASRQGNGPPHHLIGPPRVDAQADGHLHRLVEAGVAQAAGQVEGLTGPVRLVPVETLVRRRCTSFHVSASLPPSRSPGRGEVIPWLRDWIKLRL